MAKRTNAGLLEQLRSIGLVDHSAATDWWARFDRQAQDELALVGDGRQLLDLVAVDVLTTADWTLALFEDWQHDQVAVVISHEEAATVLAVKVLEDDVDCAINMGLRAAGLRLMPRPATERAGMVAA